VRTPNAAAGIRGSALFVRYNPETDTTIVGALTNSGIEVFNRDASQRQKLKAGYMAVLVKDRIERVYEFDLNTFYKTSELAQGLDLTQTEATPSPDEAIAQVQAETAEAAKAQSPMTGERVIENPRFVQLPTNRDLPNVNTSVVDGNLSSGEPNFDGAGDTFDVRTLLEGGEIQDTQSRPGFPNNPGSGGDNPGRGDDDGPGGNGGNGNDPGQGNNPPGPGGNGGGRGNGGNGNDPGRGNNPPGVGGNAGGRGNSGDRQ
jgi:hypothetical protein